MERSLIESLLRGTFSERVGVRLVSIRRGRRWWFRSHLPTIGSAMRLWRLRVLGATRGLLGVACGLRRVIRRGATRACSARRRASADRRHRHLPAPLIAPNVGRTRFYRLACGLRRVVPVISVPPRPIVVVAPCRIDSIRAESVVARIKRVVVETGILVTVCASAAASVLVGEKRL